MPELRFAITQQQKSLHRLLNHDNVTSYSIWLPCQLQDAFSLFALEFHKTKINDYSSYAVLIQWSL